jgi:probable HAF family extracellular repeat protein
MKPRFASTADLTDTGADQSFTLDVVAPLNTTDFHTSKDLHHAQLANLAAMARSIFHQVGATEVAQPELTTLVNFNGTNGSDPISGLIADPLSSTNNTSAIATFEGLGFLPGGDISYAYGVNANGSVVVGQSNNASGITEAFRWTAASGTVGLGFLPGGEVREPFFRKRVTSILGRGPSFFCRPNWMDVIRIAVTSPKA